MPHVLARLLSGQEVELSLEPQATLVQLRRQLEAALQVPVRLQRLPRGWPIRA